jgi:hypothetical protein
MRRDKRPPLPEKEQLPHYTPFDSVESDEQADLSNVLVGLWQPDIIDDAALKSEKAHSEQPVSPEPEPSPIRPYTVSVDELVANFRVYTNYLANNPQALERRLAEAQEKRAAQRAERATQKEMRRRAKLEGRAA